MAHPTCYADGCETASRAAGLCTKHYLRLRRHGSFDLPRRDPADRFWPKVDKNGTVPPHRPELGQCWVWTAGRFGDGYGEFYGGPGRGPVRAHRFAYELLVGQIPEAREIDHLCWNPICVNPAHLEPVTRAVHNQRTQPRTKDRARRR